MSGTHLMPGKIPLLVKVSLAPLVAGLIFLVILAWQVHATGEIEQDAAAINQAGSQRARLFKLVILTEQYTEHGEPRIRALIDRETTTFETVLHGLKHGDPRYNLRSTGDPEFIASLDKNTEEWNRTIKPLLQNVLAASASRETRRTLKDRVEEYAARIDGSVALRQAYSEKKVDALRNLLWLFLFASIVVAVGSLIYIYAIILKPMEAQKTLIETDRRAILGLKRYAEDIIASLPAGLIVVDDALRVLSVNRSFRELFGRENGEELPGRKLEDILPLPGLREQAQGVLAGGTAVGGIDVALGEKQLRLAIAGIRLAEEEEEEEEEDRLLVVVEDVTEEQRLRAQARAHETRYRELVQDLDAIVWEADAATFAFTFVNRRAEAILGYPVERWLTGPDFWVNLIHPEDRDQTVAFCREATAQGRDHAFEYRVVAADGRVVWLRDVVHVVRDKEGHAQRLGGVMMVITERKAAEAALRDLNRELERRVAQRTADLERANRELEAFSYSISHDLRAPLRAINGFAHLLGEEYGGSIDGRGKDYLRRVRAGAEKMGNLIDDLLELSRISRQEMRRGPVDLSALARTVGEELHAAEPGRRVEWAIMPGVQATGDAVLIETVLHNLIGNAWKYSSKREAARIEFGISEEGGRLAYFVRDNGAGFDMAHAGKLFGAFQRLHSPAEFPGTGIGLATVARVIHRHGGEVWAEAEPGKGATFFFTLPRAAGA
jgi:PAS domain S-box-containing protein